MAGRPLGNMVINLGLDNNGMIKGAKEAESMVATLKAKFEGISTPVLGSPDFSALSRSADSFSVAQENIAKAAQRTGQFKESLSQAIPLLSSVNAEAANIAQWSVNIAGAGRALLTLGGPIALAVSGVVLLGKAFADTVGKVHAMRQKMGENAMKESKNAIEFMKKEEARVKQLQAELDKLEGNRKEMTKSKDGAWLNKEQQKQHNDMLEQRKQIQQKILDIQRQQIMRQEEARRQMEEYARLSTAASHVIESLRTPAEAFKETINQLAELKNKQFIDMDMFERGARQAIEKLQATKLKVEFSTPPVGAAERYTMEGFSAVQAGMRQAMDEKRNEEQRRKQHEETNQLLREVRGAVENSNRGPAIRQVSI